MRQKHAVISIKIHLHFCTALRWWRVWIILNLRHVSVARIILQEHIDEVAFEG